MNLHVCNLSVVPLRANPDDTSEMVSQVLFGEYLEVLEKKNQWRKIRCLHDDYSGWLDEKQIEKISIDNKLLHQKSSRLISNVKEIQSPNGKITLTKGALLAQGSNFLPWTNDFLISDDIETKESLEKTILSYLNTPYLWGGRTLFGIDCSGFTQIVFAIHNLKLPRDAKDQVNIGTEIQFENIKPYDLIFFINEQKKIHHVGIALTANKIIHASGKVRIDSLLSHGILNVESKKITHKWFSAKRII